ncbi:AbrB/MazE/SpoVT family DNA-binding domain-containing protein [Sphingomonas sp. RIT328]|uniref:AbrB/MazE/SpoVT family DNA-binding domain-containing protein n=1 Tax=Sphingomonas sp. RIT328 TaxID=1470591 RepID=UPI0004483ADE|nr:AbrB/MazE/SpoVT family DNA-binding domain-containing protein [Sphingomonas sp. RIT328]EZP49327.1 transcriptional regulator, AbrB family [Sphingomonas sp. RIT328]
MTQQARVSDGGTVVIPADIRRELGIRQGDWLTVDRNDDGAIVLKTHDQVQREVEQVFRAMRDKALPGGSVVDELIAERRAEAQREAKERG